MATSRSRFISASYQIDTYSKEHQVKYTKHGQHNPAFPHTTETNVDIPYEQFDNADANADDISVDVHQDTTATPIDYPQDVTILRQEPTDDQNDVASDEDVEAHVSNRDDPSTLVVTFRSWFLGLLFTCLLSFVNQFFWYRTSPLFVGTLVAQLLTYPLGKYMAKILPTRQFKIFRWSFTLNPGPFTIKEHCVITAMANATCVSSYF